MGGLLCQAQRHRREPVRLRLPPSNERGTRIKRRVAEPLWGSRPARLATMLGAVP